MSISSLLPKPSSKQCRVLKDDTKSAISPGPAEQGQLIRRPLSFDSVTATQHLVKQRKKLIRKIKKCAMRKAVKKGMWPRKLYMAHARLVFLDTGHRMLPYENYLETIQGGVGRDEEVATNEGEPQASDSDDTLGGFRAGKDVVNFGVLKKRSTHTKSLHDILDGL